MSTILQMTKTEGTPPNPFKVAPITCTLEVVTPMFLAGADNRARKRGKKGKEPRNGRPAQQPEQDIPGMSDEQLKLELTRAASIKAALRFWWRAGQVNLSHQELMKKEAEIFGGISTDEDLKNKEKKQGQRAIIRLDALSVHVGSPSEWRFTQTAKDCTKKGFYDDKQYPELSYLAFGCADLEGPLRPAFMPQCKIKIEVLGIKSEHKKCIETALERFLLFGNLGAKSRRGWGSLSDGRWKTKEEIKGLVESHIISGNVANNNWSSLQGAQVLFSDSVSPSWEEALSKIGTLFHQFRKNLGADVINFRMKSGDPRRYAREPGKDHHRVANWLKNQGMKDPARGDHQDTLPDRAGFGLPYPMQFGQEKPLFEPVGNGIGDRRASPVIFKIHKLSQGYLGMVTIMGGRFLPPNGEVQAKAGNRVLTLPVADYPSVLNDFSQYLISKGFIKVSL